MAGETNSDKITRLETLSAALDVRVDHQDKSLAHTKEELRHELVRVETDVREVAKAVQRLDKDLAVCLQAMDQLEKRLDQRHNRSWDLWKLVLAAIIGGILTVAVGLASKTLDRLLVPGSGRRVPTAPSAPPGR